MVRFHARHAAWVLLVLFAWAAAANEADPNTNVLPADEVAGASFKNCEGEKVNYTVKIDGEEKAAGCLFSGRTQKLGDSIEACASPGQLITVTFFIHGLFVWDHTWTVTQP